MSESELALQVQGPCATVHTIMTTHRQKATDLAHCEVWSRLLLHLHSRGQGFLKQGLQTAQQWWWWWNEYLSGRVDERGVDALWSC